jgi:hypothetical protein
MDTNLEGNVEIAKKGETQLGTPVPMPEIPACKGR